MIDGNPWDRLPGEPSVWFERFEFFRLQGPKRNLLRTVVSYLGDPKSGKRTSVPGSWRNAFRKYSWKSRVDAWDRSESDRIRKEYEDEAKKDRTERIALLKGLRIKLAQSIIKFDPETVRLGELSQAIRIVTEELRKEYDQEPVERVEVGDPGDFRKLEDLSDEELERIIADDNDDDEDFS